MSDRINSSDTVDLRVLVSESSVYLECPTDNSAVKISSWLSGVLEFVVLELVVQPQKTSILGFCLADRVIKKKRSYYLDQFSIPDGVIDVVFCFISTLPGFRQVFLLPEEQESDELV